MMKTNNQAFQKRFSHVETMDNIHHSNCLEISGNSIYYGGNVCF